MRRGYGRHGILRPHEILKRLGLSTKYPKDEDSPLVILAGAAWVMDANFAAKQDIDESPAGNDRKTIIGNQAYQGRHFFFPPETTCNFTPEGLMFFLRRRLTLSAACVLRRSSAACACGSILAIRPSKL